MRLLTSSRKTGLGERGFHSHSLHDSVINTGVRKTKRSQKSISLHRRYPASRLLDHFSTSLKDTELPSHISPGGPAEKVAAPRFRYCTKTTVEPQKPVLNKNFSECKREEEGLTGTWHQPVSEGSVTRRGLTGIPFHVVGVYPDSHPSKARCLQLKWL